MNQRAIMANLPTANAEVAISYHRDLNAVTTYIKEKARPHQSAASGR